MIRIDFPAVHLIAERTPTSRKEHWCVACGALIPRGCRHQLFVYREEAALDARKSLHAVRVHIRCPEVPHG